VVHVPIGEDSRVIEIERSLEAMQALVGGYLEERPAGNGLVVMCNEEGMMLNLPHNGCGLLGAYFFTRVNEDGDSVSLTEDECLRIRAHVAANRGVRHTGALGAMQVEVLESFEELEAMLRRRREAHRERN
jgi:hypothetical protein